MRVKGATVQQLLLAAALLAGVCWNLAEAAELRAVDLRTGATGTRAELRLDQQAAYQLITLSNPERLVVDLSGTRQARALRLPAANGLVRSVRSGQPTPGALRIVFDLASPVVALKPHFEAAPDGQRLVLEWPEDGAAPPTDAVAAQAKPVAPAIARATATAPVAATASTSPTSVASTGPVLVPIVAENTPERPVPPPSAASVTDEAAARVAATTPVPSTAPSTQTPGKTIDDLSRRAGMRPLVIAIDAGHGGQDTGALGGDGTREKDVTLAIARELARQVDATPGLKAYLTRDTDYFIPLPQRARKAHAAHADIFISVHADSFTSPDARGASVFVLSTRGASSQRARWLADKENAADVIGGDKAHSGDSVLTSVLLDLTQSGNMKVSTDAAGLVLGNLDAIGNLHKGEVERANFAVLRTSDNMPAMLVETGFISNRDEERRLRDPQYQGELARAILGGVTQYFTRQPPPGTLYAARAEASNASAPAQGIGGSGGR